VTRRLSISTLQVASLNSESLDRQKDDLRLGLKTVIIQREHVQSQFGGEETVFMSFSTDIAHLVAGQLSRFVTLNRHQLAGQVVNLDFWLAEVRHALAVIDGYGVRFVKMHGAQERYVTGHGTTESVPDVDGYTKRQASPPRRIADRELQKARRELTEATTKFLERCRREDLISESEASNAIGSLSLK
jgi:hypothetical protein